MFRPVLAATCLLLTIGAAGSASAAAQTTTALEVRVVDKPRYVRGTDGRTHIDYTLALTNDFTADVTVTSLEVLGRRGESLLKLEGDALATATNQLFSFTPTRTVPASGTVVTIVDIVLPARRRARARLPDKLRHRVRYELPPDAPFRSIIGSTRVDRPVVGLDRRRPEVVASPLSGGGWIALNACCLQGSHRLILAGNGRLGGPETFAIDWTRARDGRVAEGDGSQNSQWYGHGATIRAAAGGRVVTVRNDVPEVPPGTVAVENPTLQGPDDYGGNHVVIRMRRGVYALYAHMIPGSIRVREGQRVRRGDRIGLLGNTGNTAAPHLHFQLMEGPVPLTSDALPFVINRFRFQGIAEFSPECCGVTFNGRSRSVRRAYPLSNSVSGF